MLIYVFDNIGIFVFFYKPCGVCGFVEIRLIIPCDTLRRILGIAYQYDRVFVIFLDRKRPKELAERIIKDLEVVTPSSHTPVRRLSGGNIQKVLVGREIAAAPTVLMVAYPVRGLDINSSYTIYNLLNEQKENGVAVIYVGEDLDVLVELCDRILVICAGRVTGILDGRNTTKEEIGLYMTDSADTGKEANE